MSPVLIISVRNLRKQAANCTLYEFEDLIQTFHDATIYAPTSEHALNRKIFRTCKQLSCSNRIAHYSSMYPAHNVLHADHKLILVIADNPYQLHLLNQIKGWRDHPAKKACYLTELWPGSLDEKFVLNEPFEDYDHFFLGLSNSVDLLKEKFDVSCSFLPVGVDTDVFASIQPDLARPIDVNYPGRKLKPIHDQLVQLCDSKNQFYLFDTVSGIGVENHAEHRKKYADILKRSKTGIAFPAKFGMGGYTNNAMEIGWRYYEFAAAGTVIIGKAPDNENFKTYFGWEDSVIDISEGDIGCVLTDLLSNDEWLVSIHRRNIQQSMLRNDWVYRWLDILKHFSLDPSKAALERLNRLESQAASLF